MPGAGGCQKAPPKHGAARDTRRHAADHEGGPEPGATGQRPAAAKGCGPEEGGEEPRPDPPPSPPCCPPSGPRDAGDGPMGRQPSTPPMARGGPPPPESRGARGGNAAKPVRHRPARRRPPAPTVTTTRRRTNVSTQGRPADHTRGQQGNMNWGRMEAAVSKN